MAPPSFFPYLSRIKTLGYKLRGPVAFLSCLIFSSCSFYFGITQEDRKRYIQMSYLAFSGNRKEDSLNLFFFFPTLRSTLQNAETFL